MDELAEAVQTCATLPGEIARMQAAAANMAREIHMTADAVAKEIGREPTLSEMASARPDWLQAAINFPTLQTQIIMALCRQSAALEHIVVVLKDALAPHLTPESLAELTAIGLYGSPAAPSE